MIHGITIELCDPAEVRHIHRITCDECGRRETVTTTDGEAPFQSWEIDGGRAFCPLCQRHRVQ